MVGAGDWGRQGEGELAFWMPLQKLMEKRGRVELGLIGIMRSSTGSSVS